MPFLTIFGEFDYLVHFFFLFKVDIRIEHEKLRQTMYMTI